MADIIHTLRAFALGLLMPDETALRLDSSLPVANGFLNRRVGRES